MAKLKDLKLNEELPSSGASSYNDLTDKPDLSDLHAPGSDNQTLPVNSDFTLNGLSEKSYNNLTDKPTIPTISDTAYDATSWDANTDGATKNAIRDKFESLPAVHTQNTDSGTTANLFTINSTSTKGKYEFIAATGSDDVTLQITNEVLTANRTHYHQDGDGTLAFLSDIPTVSDTAYDVTSWNDNLDAPSKNAVRDKFESLSSGGLTKAQTLAIGLL